MDTLEQGTGKEKRRSAAAVSPFRRRVYDTLGAVPAGQVTTYGRLAAAVGCGSARAIGGALRANPFAPRVPCHRVIAADLTLGGFSGATAGPELKRKLRLLAAEGVRFYNGRLAEPDRLYAFDRAKNSLA